YRVGFRAMPAAASPVGQQLAPAGLAGVSLSQSDQPLYEADAGATVSRLAGALGPSSGDGGDLCRSAALSGHGLQSQRLVAPGQNRRVEARRRRLLYQARRAQADLGARTGQERACEIARPATAPGVGHGGGPSPAALPANRQRNPQLEGKLAAGPAGVSPGPGAGLSH